MYTIDNGSNVEDTSCRRLINLPYEPRRRHARPFIRPFDHPARNDFGDADVSINDGRPCEFVPDDSSGYVHERVSFLGPFEYRTRELFLFSGAIVSRYFPPAIVERKRIDRRIAVINGSIITYGETIVVKNIPTVCSQDPLPTGTAVALPPPSTENAVCLYSPAYFMDDVIRTYDLKTNPFTPPSDTICFDYLCSKSTRVPVFTSRRALSTFRLPTTLFPSVRFVGTRQPDVITRII